MALHITSMARGRCRKALPWVAHVATNLCCENGDTLLPYVGVKNLCTLLLAASLADNLGKPFGKVTILGDGRTHDGVDIVFCGPFVKACGALPTAVLYAVFVSVRQKRPTFLAKWQTFVAKHSHDLLDRRGLGRQGVLLLQPALPASYLLQDQAQRTLPRAGLSPIEIQRGFQAAVSQQRQSGVRRDRLRGGVQDLSRKAHSLAQGMAKQVQRILDPTRPKQRGGIQHGAQLPGTEAPGFLGQGHGPIQQGLLQVVSDEPHPEVEQRALTEGGLLGAKAVQHHLPALVHHGQLDCVPITDVAVPLQQRGQGQQARFDRLVASRARAIAFGQRVLKVCVQEFVAALAQKHKKLPRLAGTGGYGLLCCAQRDGWIPHDGLLKVEGLQPTSAYQITAMLLLSTLSKPLLKQLISVLGTDRESFPSISSSLINALLRARFHHFQLQAMHLPMALWVK